ncbi:hypothetical protein GPECTOR_7g1287 [Gonium pectorale]|uniref:F-box domain-containing protein n=1 Tax=Gonium pectorale TaxID=33097 RepID=A0A150GU94_GONPE|nr:hypothetical protein GPECTOR_7g1287 [Gonium pectorale]|eukprot:KXZ53391.1 hypothetical protein GPECTOR_7g1287 [Gonium pectorale]
MSPSADVLPGDFLLLVFARLPGCDLAAAACTCRLWEQLTREGWRAAVQRRWRHGGARWRDAELAGDWKRIYRERHVREDALDVVLSAGEAALDQLARLLEPPDLEDGREGEGRDGADGDRGDSGDSEGAPGRRRSGVRGAVRELRLDPMLQRMYAERTQCRQLLLLRCC